MISYRVLSYAVNTISANPFLMIETQSVIGKKKKFFRLNGYDGMQMLEILKGLPVGSLIKLDTDRNSLVVVNSRGTTVKFSLETVKTLVSA